MQETSAQPTGEAIHDRTGLQLVQDNYEQVAAAFDGFTPPLNDHGHLERGGHYRTDRVRRPDDYHTDTHHTESSFNPEQRAYVGASIAALNTLANGRSLVAVETEPEPLSVRIQRRFLAQPLEQASFDQSVYDSILDLFDDFGRLYPNLLPALNAVNKVAGAEGTEVAFGATRRKLEEALQGNARDSRPYPHSDKPGGHFTGIHPNTSGIPIEYEVWCSGESLAKNIVRQATEAADSLAATPDVQSRYNPENDPYWTVHFDLQEALIAQVEQAALAVAASREQSGSANS